MVIPARARDCSYSAMRSRITRGTDLASLPGSTGTTIANLATKSPPGSARRVRPGVEMLIAGGVRAIVSRWRRPVFRAGAHRRRGVVTDGLLSERDGRPARHRSGRVPFRRPPEAG